MAVKKPPVRIFLGTEDGQWRAERVFFYSIEQVRDPERTYEIHLMKNLEGFDRSGWRTGFTNYRFAIPEFAGFQGKAIYNDVDQIYLADPAALFDLDMMGHGYLSVSPEDTSVMLIDCIRMSRWWNRAKAAGGRKTSLITRPASELGLWGKLEDGWNARDLEFRAGASKVFHFTALHTQPWQPFPGLYSYHPHPFAEVWSRLERQADEQGYHVFGPERPSPRFAGIVGRDRSAAPVSESAAAFLVASRSRSVLAVTPDGTYPADIAAAGDFDITSCRADLVASETAQYDAVAAVGTLDQCPAEDVPWLLEVLFTRTSNVVWLAVVCSTGVSNREADIDVTRTIRSAGWWRQRIAGVAARHPSIAWQLDAFDQNNRQTVLRAEGLGPSLPSVWVLEGKREGDNAQLRRLAEALDWPVEYQKLIFNPLHAIPNFLLGASLVHLKPGSRVPLRPPWPDVVVALGKRSSGVARWIGKQSDGRTKLVHVGRPWARLDAFDLVVTTPQYRLPARSNVLHNTLPLTGVMSESLKKDRNRTRERFKHLERPLIAVLVGGSSWSYVFNRSTARRLGRTASRRARELGGSLLVTTSPRTAKKAADVLANSIDVPCCLHRFELNGKDNPYLDYLAAADEILVTGESASMIADAIATGRPVDVFRLPHTLPGKLSSIVGRLAGSLRGKSYRGTPRQQRALERFYDRLVVRGLLTRPRDLEYLHRVLALQGLVRTMDGEYPRVAPTRDETEHTVARIKRLFSEGRIVSDQANSKPEHERPGG